jgi:hypothetical protein
VREKAFPASCVGSGAAGAGVVFAGCVCRTLRYREYLDGVEGAFFSSDMAGRVASEGFS